jgi:hypothetical protein
MGSSHQPPSDWLERRPPNRRWPKQLAREIYFACEIANEIIWNCSPSIAVPAETFHFSSAGSQHQFSSKILGISMNFLVNRLSANCWKIKNYHTRCQQTSASSNPNLYLPAPLYASIPFFVSPSIKEPTRRATCIIGIIDSWLTKHIRWLPA